MWAPRDGWIVMIWPKWFTELASTADWLSAEFDTLVSAIDVYDGDFWEHHLWRGGAELDRFSSCPDYFTKDRREIKRLKQEWVGHPQVLAETFGVPAEFIAPYLIPPHSSGIFGRWLGRRKPFPDDHSTLEDVWVFVDFWRRVGITFPDTEPPARSVRFSHPHPDPSPGGGPGRG